jgi:hypothetical protein
MIGHRKPARIGFDALLGVEADPDSNGNECAEGTVYTSTKLDPIVLGFRPVRASSEELQRHKGRLGQTF